MTELDEDGAPSAGGRGHAGRGHDGRVRDGRGHGACQPRADGMLTGDGATTLALAGPRLLAHADGLGVHGLFVWGGGRIGGVRLQPPVPRGAQATVEPGRLSFAWPGGAFAATALQDLPAIEIRVRGSGMALVPHDVRTAPAGLGDGPGARRRRDEEGWRVDAPWAAMRLWAPGSAWVDRALHLPAGDARAWLVAGEDRDEIEPVLARLRDDPAAPGARHDAWIAELRDRFEVDDPLLRSLFVHGIANAEAARKELAGGTFAGYAAGHAYALPARSYYRDAYWTMQALLPLRPERAAEQLRLLAHGVQPDGTAPSAVVRTSVAGMRAWRTRRTSDPSLAEDHPHDDAWWPDHVDAPSLFVLLARDAVAWTGRTGLLHDDVAGATILDRIGWIAEGIVRGVDARGLPVKPLHDRDWADNVFRSGAVTYDVGLAYGALRAAADAWREQRPERAEGWRAAAERMRDAATRVLFDEAHGHYREFVEPDGGDSGGREPGTLAIDTLTALRFGLADEGQARATLAAMRARLETRHDDTQPYGDWGVSCLRPGYPAWVRRRGKARFAYRYHDGGDWPYWDGVYAEQRLLRGIDGWRYPLTRWWEVGLAHGRTTPVEYQSPPWPAGSPATGWSSMPAAAVMSGGYGLRPARRPIHPPWGDSVLRDVLVGGRRATLITRGHALEVHRHDDS